MKKKLVLGAVALVCAYILVGIYFEKISQRSYVAKGNTCYAVLYTCSPLESYFSDEIGCGCRVSLLKPFVPLINLFYKPLYSNEEIVIPEVRYNKK